MKKINKPFLSLSQIINMSVGFLGIQFGFALQNGNASRILQTYGADVEHLSLFWLAAPLTGMIVQPIIGHYSDRTWTKLGRRRPFFLTGAILASLALIFMPNASFLTGLLPAVLVGAVFLMFMDASFNVAMEPFRALVADNLPDEQSTTGFSVQTALIGIGAVAGGFLPQILNQNFGISNESVNGNVQENVLYSFYIGAVVILIAILWTVFTTKEYSAEQRASFGFEGETEKHGLLEIVKDFVAMPKTMKQLGLVQFFSWIALFSMWVYSTPAIAHQVYGLALTDHNSKSYNNAGDWVSSLFAIYNGVSAIYALLLPTLAGKFGKKATHAFSLVCGGIGLLSIYFIKDPDILIFSMVGVGIAWASILAMPYAILANSIPIKKIGVYMGIFNFFITFPQIVNGLFSGLMLKYVFNSNSIYAIVLAGFFMICGAISVMFVKESN
ncbi:maltose/moltooligosaccharide transporter [Pseudarcicella hirudinis]|uniref:Maltose/moltooligosaccharide transporter n=1 Tax=Pseudarcicella hirudinis TaxID=1079859 RepID=A0A1I5UY29_9BACT|nr:MFS transporter [Pseudarcicella hirudinis]SFQ00175.1 maltose/moltooligosaccharide transporter [Pseudarcicella hirudinis]